MWSRGTFTHATHNTMHVSVKHTQLQTRCRPQGPLLPLTSLPWRRRSRTRRSTRTFLSVLLGVRKEINNFMKNLSKDNRNKVQHCGPHLHRPHPGDTLRAGPVPLGARAMTKRLRPVPLGARASAEPRPTQVMAVMCASRPNLERPPRCGPVRKKAAQLLQPRALCLCLRTWRRRGPRQSPFSRTRSSYTASSNYMMRGAPSPQLWYAFGVGASTTRLE